MYKYILVGDLHSKPANLDETKRIFEKISEVALRHEVYNVILLGDLFDTHGVVHLPVMLCYHQLFSKYYNLTFTCLVGNHDYVTHGDYKQNSLIAFKDMGNVRVVDDLSELGEFDVMPHCSEDKFFELCEKKMSSTLICHHTFAGAQYENGFYAPEGIDLDKVPYKTIISGHVHLNHQVGKCFYPGTPRWLKESDANQDKGIWLWDGQKDFKFISTEDVCRKIFSFDIKHESDLSISINSQHRYIFNVYGNNTFLKRVMEKYPQGVEIRHVPVNEKKSLVQEANGISNSLKSFVLNHYNPLYDISKDELWGIINQRLIE